MLRLVMHRLGCCSRFFHQRGILLGNLVHLGNRLIDLLYPGALLVAGSSDLRHDIGYPPNAGNYFFHGPAGLANQFGPTFHLRHGITNQVLDFLGRRAGTLRQAGDTYSLTLPAVDDETLIPAVIRDITAMGTSVHLVEPGRMSLEERLLGILRAGDAERARTTS